jgi:hypothetical protein
MRVRFKVNLGSRDAERFGLHFEHCGKGMTPEVADEAGEWLIRHGIAEQLAAEPTPEPVVGVSPRPAIAEAQAPEIRSTTKTSPKAGNKNKES